MNTTNTKKKIMNQPAKDCKKKRDPNKQVDGRNIMIEDLNNPHIFSVYHGRDFGSSRYNSSWNSSNCKQISYKRQDISHAEVVEEARRIGAKIIIETPKKDGSGFYYLKGIEFDWDFCKDQIETCLTRETKSSKRAWLLTNPNPKNEIIVTAEPL